ncbi:MAG: c-type cytochrome [Kofleriaceae bacterium]
MKIVLGALLVAACATDPVEIDPALCPESGTPLTYDNFGAGFMADNCNRCHSEAKSGAPRAFNFDTVEAVRDHADRIFARAAADNVSMPPGPDDPPPAEREQLAEWLACGAP